MNILGCEVVGERIWKAFFPQMRRIFNGLWELEDLFHTNPP